MELAVLSIDALEALLQELELLVFGGDLRLEEGDNGGRLFKELVLQDLSLETRLTFLEVLDEADEVADVRRAGLDLGRGFGEVHSERAREGGGGAGVLRGCRRRSRGGGLGRRRRARGKSCALVLRRRRTPLKPHRRFHFPGDHLPLSRFPFSVFRFPFYLDRSMEIRRVGMAGTHGEWYCAKDDDGMGLD